MHVCTAIFLKWQINLALFVNKLRLGVMGTGKPFMYTKNSRGPQTEHRGTSLQTGIPGEMLLQFKLTNAKFNKIIVANKPYKK